MLNETHNAITENALQTMESVQNLITSARTMLALTPDIDPDVVEMVNMLCSALESVSRMFANSTAQAVNYSEMLDSVYVRMNALFDKLEGK